jgi:hypothetical protein
MRPSIGADAEQTHAFHANIILDYLDPNLGEIFRVFGMPMTTWVIYAMLRHGHVSADIPKFLSFCADHPDNAPDNLLEPLGYDVEQWRRFPPKRRLDSLWQVLEGYDGPTLEEVLKYEEAIGKALLKSGHHLSDVDSEFCGRILILQEAYARIANIKMKASAVCTIFFTTPIPPLPEDFTEELWNLLTSEDDDDVLLFVQQAGPDFLAPPFTTAQSLVALSTGQRALLFLPFLDEFPEAVQSRIDQQPRVSPYLDSLGAFASILSRDCKLKRHLQICDSELTRLL